MGRANGGKRDRKWLGVRLKNRHAFIRLMDKRGVSVRGLAQACGLKGHGMIQQLRDGRRLGCSSRSAYAISATLGVDPQYLFQVHASSPAPRTVAHHDAATRAKQEVER